MWVTYIAFTARMDKVFLVLKEHRYILDALVMKINTLLRNSSIEEQDPEMLEGIHFPLNDSEDVASLESKLLNPSEEKKVVSKYVTIIVAWNGRALNLDLNKFS